MGEATFLNLGIGVGTVLFSVGGAWGFIRFGIRENTRRIVSLEGSRGKIYDELKNQGEKLVSIDTKVDILLKQTGV